MSRFQKPKQDKLKSTEGFGIALGMYNPMLSDLYCWFQMLQGISDTKEKKKMENAEWEDTEKLQINAEILKSCKY